MVKVDLITGFLGSGKTTFLKKYVSYLLGRGERIGILENDYGAVNVDMMLLQELSGENCELETVAGAYDFDCHKRRFKTKLIAMGMSGFDRVIIEPSGIFDVDEFFDVLHESPLDRWYEIGSVISIVDATAYKVRSDSSRYLLACQVANAGSVIFSKCQLASAYDISDKIKELNSVMEQFKCDRRFDDDVIAKDWSELSDEDFERIASSGYVSEDYTKLPLSDNSYSSLYFMNTGLSPSAARSAAEEILGDKACGKVFRVKGFVREDGKWYELNATAKQLELKPIELGQDIIIVIGEELVEDKIRSYF